jgi:hypothetical protein
MEPDDLTTPLAELQPPEQPTVVRVPGTPGPALNRPADIARGFIPGTMVTERYRIVALLGRGGWAPSIAPMTSVLGQPVALKFIDIGSDAGGVEFLYHEVRVARPDRRT